MELTHLLALTAFSIISGITPGPNNIMLMSSGANIGFYRTVPHLAGIMFGFSLMILLVGIGLMQLFTTLPLLQTILHYGCMAYLFYLAYKIASSSHLNGKQQRYQPMSFLAAANFQWINPKAWSMSLTAVTLYSSGADNIYLLLLIVTVFFFSYLPSACLWIFAGTKLQSYLNNKNTLKYFNYTMASSLVISMLLTI